MGFNRILCVCTGNICRSPLAEAYIARALPTRNVGSAGIAAVVGHGIETNAAVIAQREQLAVDAHVARQLDEDVLRDYDLVLVMEAGQKNWISERFPHARGKVFMLSKWDDGEDITDPYRRSSELFDAVYARMQGCMDSWIKKLASF